MNEIMIKSKKFVCVGGIAIRIAYTYMSLLLFGVI